MGVNVSVFCHCTPANVGIQDATTTKKITPFAVAILITVHVCFHRGMCWVRMRAYADEFKREGCVGRGVGVEGWQGDGR